MSTKLLLANEQIQATSVRLIYPDGTNAVVDIHTACQIRDEFELDLVQMNDNEVPVCKIMDFARYQYDIKQSEKAQKKKQRAATVNVKEIQLKVNIQDHDMKIKQKQVQKFLSNRDQCRISLRLTGRARGNQDMQQLAKDKVDIFIQEIGVFTMVQPVTLAGDTISVIVKTKE